MVPGDFAKYRKAGRYQCCVMGLVGELLHRVDGDVGHYRWSLSPQATTPTLTADDDTCAARQAAFEGDWTHTACKLEGRDCLGIVEVDTYSTNRWNPYGEFTYGQCRRTDGSARWRPSGPAR